MVANTPGRTLAFGSSIAHKDTLCHAEILSQGWV